MQGGVCFYGAGAAAETKDGTGMRTCYFARFVAMLLLFVLLIVLIKIFCCNLSEDTQPWFQVSFPKRLRTASAAVNYGYGLKVALNMHLSVRV